MTRADHEFGRPLPSQAESPGRFELKDSGERTTFSSGAQRDVQSDLKGRYDLLPPLGIHRVAVVFGKGAKKYEPRNWEKGMPVWKFIDSALRHINCHQAGMTDEDHLGQAAWNLLCAMQTEELVRLGRLPAEFGQSATMMHGPVDLLETVKEPSR